MLRTAPLTSHTRTINRTEVKIFVFLYNQFAAFEIIQLLLLLKNKGEVITFSSGPNVEMSEEQLKVIADRSVEEVDASEVDLLVFPGGDPRPYMENQVLMKLIREVHDLGKPIAAICGGPGFLASAGILDNKRIAHGFAPEDAEVVFSNSEITNEDVVVEENIITADGQAYAEFAVTVYGHLGLFEEPGEEEQTLLWLKNQRKS